MRSFCEDLKTRIAEVLLEMTALTAEEPWVRLPERHRVDGLPQVLQRLFDWALCDSEQEAHRVMALDVAALHGRTRREQAYADDLPLREYYLLREAIWRVLRRLCPTDVEGEGYVAMSRVDRAITWLTRASLLGYHSPELDARGQWPARLHELCAEAWLPPAGLA